MSIFEHNINQRTNGWQTWQVDAAGKEIPGTRQRLHPGSYAGRKIQFHQCYIVKQPWWLRLWRRLIP